jgi:hypothetical protein
MSIQRDVYRSTKRIFTSCFWACDWNILSPVLPRSCTLNNDWSHTLLYNFENQNCKIPSSYLFANFIDFFHAYAIVAKALLVSFTLLLLRNTASAYLLNISMMVRIYWCLQLSANLQFRIRTNVSWRVSKRGRKAVTSFYELVMLQKEAAERARERDSHPERIGRRRALHGAR